MKQIIQRTRDEVYHLWVAALRSGEYKQASGQLRDVDYGWENDKVTVKSVIGFCCLGVLCDLAHKDGGPTWDEDDGTGNLFSDDGEPPVYIKEFMNLDDDMIAELITMNDDQSATFDEIADVIEELIMPAVGVK